MVWLTLSTDTADRFGGERGAETYKYNTALRTVDGYSTQYPNLWLQDWDAMSEGHDEYYDWANNDWLHHGPEGELAYAQAQYDAINRCGGN